MRRANKKLSLLAVSALLSLGLSSNVLAAEQAHSQFKLINEAGNNKVVYATQGERTTVAVDNNQAGPVTERTGSTPLNIYVKDADSGLLPTQPVATITAPLTAALQTVTVRATGDGDYQAQVIASPLTPAPVGKVVY